MSNVMVDNWLMENVVKDIQENRIHNSDAYTDLLMAIVLWDDVFYPQNKYNWWNSFPSSVQNILQPLDDKIENYFDESFIEFLSYKKWSYEDYIRYKWINTPSTEEDIIDIGAIRYMMLSNCNGCSYLPCRKRQEFLSKHYNPEKISKMLRRIEMQEGLNKKVNEFWNRYSETYNLFATEADKIIKMPVLSKFIFDNTPNGMLPIEYAFHLKNEGSVVKYRKYLDELQTALESGRIREYNILVKYSDEVASNVMSLDRKKILSASVGINISLIPPFQLSVAASASKEFSMGYKKMPLTFLRDMTEHAIGN